MIKQLIRDESGVALGIAIFVMVIVGVMGAGLLVFVRNDLEAVIEVNQGQKAFDVADAGAQVAKQQVLGDKIAAHYDVDDSTNVNYLHSGCNIDPADPTYGSGESIDRIPSGENWSPEAGGQTRTFAGGQFTVTIRWLNPDPPSGTPDECKAPVPGPLPSGTDYFKVISTGEYRNATRRIETIYETYNLNVPRAYYTPGNIDIKGTAKIRNVSLFSGGNPDGTGGNITVAGGAEITGEDVAYGDWNNPPSDQFNKTGRKKADGTPYTEAGLGAVGTISGSDMRGTRDYDGSGAYAGPKFYKELPDPENQTNDQMTFPFNIANQPDANRLCDEAKAQDNYTSDPTTSGTTNFSAWPDSSSNQTVVCYEFTDLNNSHTLRWTVGGNTNLDAPYEGCKGPIREGTLVIKNGGFGIKSGSNVALFRGVVITRGPEETQNSEVGDADLTGNNCLDGFINSTGPIKIAGSVIPASSQEANDRPGFYGVRTWGWRELYE